MTFWIKNNGLKELFRLLFLAAVLALLLVVGVLYFTENKTPLLPGAAPSPFQSYESVRKDYEIKLAGNVQNMLEKIVGQGAVSVSVQADVIFTERAVNDEFRRAASRRTVQDIQNMGTVRRISVAVLVDQAHLTPALQQSMTRLVETAVGFDAVRGDRISIIPSQFKKNVWHFLPEGNAVRVLEFMTMLALLIVAFLIVLMRGGNDSALVTTGGPVAFVPDTRPVQSLQVRRSSQINGSVTSQTLADAMRVVDQNPEAALSVMKQWLHNEGEG